MLSAAAPRGADDPPADASLIRVPARPTTRSAASATPPAQPPRPADLTAEQLRDLHARLAAGDAQALTDVHARYARYLVAVAARITADPEAAAEIAQDVLVHLWEHPLRFDPDRGSLRAYLAVITRRRAIDWLRRENARRPSDAVARELAARSDTPAADTEVLAEITAAIVRRGVAELPTMLRETVELAFFDECTYREVATRLTIPEGTAKSRIRAALRKLAVRLEREGVRH
ncbi:MULTISPECIES: RNA polymerase sigma factor [unclassified Frankia]|uniref:RNA polymerase sigma factor n=1 Tax=unclassified Frankia TaxID=2632575 RepID=UPI001EF462A4|nr:MULTISPECIES: sigma-70 family RNA polymerase sigma factor [unclassified Frankia]